MAEPIYSIRMHALRQGEHHCGAERLAAAGELDDLAAALVRRALEHPRGRAESVRITLEEIDPGSALWVGLPAVTTLPVPDHRAGRAAAVTLLERAGVTPEAAATALEAIAAGSAPGGGNMRGAMLVDAARGRRLEPDPARGVRVSRMDLTPGAGAPLRRELAARGLDRPQVREALVLAAKVLAAPGLVAELCWSDDPDYPAGYVAAPGLGYRRITKLKALGDTRGGRAFFLRGEGLDLDGLIDFLERTPVLVEGAVTFHPDLEEL